MTASKEGSQGLCICSLNHRPPQSQRSVHREEIKVWANLSNLQRVQEVGRAAEVSVARETAVTVYPPALAASDSNHEPGR